MANPHSCDMAVSMGLDPVTAHRPYGCSQANIEYEVMEGKRIHKLGYLILIFLPRLIICILFALINLSSTNGIEILGHRL
jgi:hypothetical protein